MAAKDSLGIHWFPNNFQTLTTPVGSLTPPFGVSWVDTVFPTTNTPYTVEWLGKNKMALFDGNISLCDLPGTSPTSSWPYTIS